jgi:hypothetical protein
MQQTLVRVGRPIHPDLKFMESGYKQALAPLIELLQASEPLKSDPYVMMVRDRLVSV